MECSTTHFKAAPGVVLEAGAAGPEDPSFLSDCDSVPHDGEASDVSTAESLDESSQLERTASQIKKQQKLEEVTKRIAQRRGPINDLGRIVAFLQEQQMPEGQGAVAIQESLATVVKAQKEARNFGEDLMEDMLSLDSLPNLIPEDRALRKNTIAEMESLLADLDSTKAKLAAVQKSLLAELDFAKTNMEIEPPVVRVNEPIAVPPPGRDLWEQVHLPLKFRSQEKRDCYVILATVPGLDSNDVKLQLGRGSSELCIEGVRLPTANENSTMQRRVAALLYKHSADAQKHTSLLAPDFGLKQYMDLGEGLFGRFSQTFDIPVDVDTQAIQATYEDGILQVVLPKEMRYNKRLRTPYGRQSDSLYRGAFLGRRHAEDFRHGGNLPSFWW